jgi:uncharacterized protein YdcH (DUF465 family)|tara:strand:+ start:252 stop:923 length:672 start_codon:yes stop_codon:yes gene_type:complete
MDIKEQILVALGLNKEETVKLEWQAKSEDGTIFVSTAEELEAGVDISVLTEDGTTILLPVGTYKTDTGVTFRVEEEGIVAEVMETETEEVVEEEEMEVTEELEVEDDAFERLVERVQNLEDAIADLKEDKVGGDDEVEEMAEETVEPSTNPKSIKTTEVVEFSAEDELTKLKEENEKLKTELAAQPASAPLDTNKFSSDRKPMARKEYNKLSRREKFLHDLNK